jgi:hypothetical protein
MLSPTIEFALFFAFPFALIWGLNEIQSNQENPCSTAFLLPVVELASYVSPARQARQWCNFLRRRIICRIAE